MSSNVVFQAKVVADELALQIAMKAIELFKGENQGQFFLEELTIDSVTEQGMIREYRCYFKNFLDRATRLWCSIRIWKNYSSTRGTITENSNWRTFRITIEDERSQWIGYASGSINWEGMVPTIVHPQQMWLEPSTPYLEETASKLHPGWRYDDDYGREAVFCPDRPSGERLVTFGHHAMAEAYAQLTDPEGKLHRRTCYSNSCSNCGGELDGTGTCPNDCLAD